MRFMPDNAVVGTIGHTRRRNAIARKKSYRRAQRAARKQYSVSDYVGGIVLLFGFIVVVALFI